MVDGCGREVTDGQLLIGRRFLCVRACSDEEGNSSPEAIAAAQRKIIEEAWSIVEDVEAPRK